jgi:hypothetical protein
MPNKVYKRTDTARTIDYQDEVLYRKYPEVISAPVFFDGDRDQLTRQTQRSIKDNIYTASLALFPDTEADLISFVKAVKACGHKLVCAEEETTIAKQPIRKIAVLWVEARKHGAAMRGARKSAETKKANTAAAMKQIEHELASTNTPSKVVLAKVGIRAIGSIKNHFGFPREELQRRYQAEQKRRQRREKYREQRAN